MIGLVVLCFVGGARLFHPYRRDNSDGEKISRSTLRAQHLRAALDRVYTEVNQGNGLPKLINADSSARGECFGTRLRNYFRSLPRRTLTSSQIPGTGLPEYGDIFRYEISTDPLASPPAPQINDVVSMDGGNTRPLVQSCAAALPAEYKR